MTYINRLAARRTSVAPISRRPARRAAVVVVAATAARLALVAAVAFGPAAAPAEEVPQHLPAITLRAGMYNILAEVAQTPRQRELGLMKRTDLAQHQGMLFVFEAPGVQCFWMRNTLIPLAAAFIDDDGAIVNVEEMAPQTDASHCSAKPVRYVLEMNKGWFARRGFKAGFKLDGTPFRAP